MSSVMDMVKWEELKRLLPTVVQDVSTSEVFAVTQTTPLVFRSLVRSLQFGSHGENEDPDEWGRPIEQELYVDCDVDCLLVKARASDTQRTECRTFFHPLGQEVPPELFGKSKLILAVTQDVQRKDVLMAAFMDEVALKLTLSTGFVHYFSRKRQKLWKKGEESGNVQHFIAGRYDLKAHAVVMDNRQEGGAACHEGYRSCFFRRIEPNGSLKVIGERIFDPKQVYNK